MELGSESELGLAEVVVVEVEVEIDRLIEEATELSSESEPELDKASWRIEMYICCSSCFQALARALSKS